MKRLGAAYKLTGLRLHGGWMVDEIVQYPDDHTGSAFSVGYRVHGEHGNTAFLKAFDYSNALTAEDPALELQRLSQCYLAERTLLEWCGQRRLNRIVRALGHGTARPTDDEREPVSYLIFEEADGDARTLLGNADPADQLPRLRLAHHAAVALSQLQEQA